MEKRNKKIILTLAILILITVFLGVPSFYQDIAISIFALLIILTLFCKFINKREEIEEDIEKDFIESQPEEDVMEEVEETEEILEEVEEEIEQPEPEESYQEEVEEVSEESENKDDRV